MRCLTSPHLALQRSSPRGCHAASLPQALRCRVRLPAGHVGLGFHACAASPAHAPPTSRSANIIAPFIPTPPHVACLLCLPALPRPRPRRVCRLARAHPIARPHRAAPKLANPPLMPEPAVTHKHHPSLTLHPPGLTAPRSLAQRLQSTAETCRLPLPPARHDTLQLRPSRQALLTSPSRPCLSLPCRLAPSLQ